ncbi:MAG: SIMPL domain-containing protein [Marinobacter sp.]|uniref:SIMPL domain-containing protein n=1 Tax=Marinobacter sp. TaxID=50741 RepID=UPI00396D36DB
MNGRNHLLLPLISLTMAPALTMAGELTLTGEGTVRYEPDSAHLQFTASAEDPLANKASDQVRRQMEKWREGIESWRDQLSDYSDAQLNLYTRTIPPAERGGQSTQQAVASQTVTFSISDLTLLNPLLEQAQALGMEYSLGPQQLYHSNEPQLEREALAAAIADARAQCEFVARELKQSCGEVVTMNINSGYRPGPMMMAEARAAKDVVTSVGVREMTASVSATFTLE